MTAVPSVYTWTDDEVPDDVGMNARVRDPQNWLLGLPTYRGVNNVSTTIPAGAWTAIPMNYDEVINGFTHALNATKVYALQPGWYRYLINACFLPTAYGNTDNRGIALFKNGGGGQLGEPGGGYTSHLTTATMDNTVGSRSGFVYLNGTTDYVEMYLYQSTPSSTAITTGVTYVEWQPKLALFWQGRDA